VSNLLLDDGDRQFVFMDIVDDVTVAEAVDSKLM
jgi:hypothetical protein